MNTRSFLLAVVSAGALIGLFGNLPILNLVNCALCVWVWIGGALSVFFYQRLEGGKPALTAGQGAGLGALSGLIGALLGSVVFLLTNSISVPLFNGLARALNVEGDIFFQNGFWENLAGAFVFMIVDAILYPIFGALGAVIAANFTREPKANVEAVPNRQAL